MPYFIKNVKGGNRPWKVMKGVKPEGVEVGSSVSREMAVRAMRARYAHSKDV